MRVHWEVVPRGDVPTSAAGFYVAINPKGYITFNRKVHEQIGKAEAVLLLFDRVNSRIALKPVMAGVKNAYPVRKTANLTKVVRAARLLVEYGIKIPELLEFKDPEFDQDRQLVLDLRTARASNRSHERARAKTKAVRG